MLDARSLGDRLRSWLGVERLDPDRFPFLRRLRRAEEDIALLRLAVALIIVLAYLGNALRGGPTPVGKTAVLTLAFGYSLAVVLLQGQSFLGRLSWSAATIALDVLAITAWLSVTGGWTSLYFPLWYVSITAVGYRLNLPLTTGISVVYVAAYAGLCAATGGVGSWIEFGVRSLFIPVTGALVGFSSESYVDSEFRHRGAERRLVDVLRTMDRRFAQLLEQVPDRIVVTDPEGAVEYANGSVTELGFEEAPAGQARATGVHHGAIRSAIETGSPVEYLASSQDGAREEFWCRAAAIEDDTEPVGAVIAAREAPETIEGNPEDGWTELHVRDESQEPL